MKNNLMVEILAVANKIIKSTFLKESDLLFLSYCCDKQIEIFLKSANIDDDFIKCCQEKIITSGIVIIRYDNVKEYNSIIERAKKFYEYIKIHNIKITHFFILRNNSFRNQTDSIIKDDDI